MRTNRAVDFLEKIQQEDKDFLERMEKKHGAATICADCGKNTAVGRYPFWHRYARSLCSSCGKEYYELLKSIGAVD